MTYWKGDDRMDENPKILACSVEARWLFVCGNCYAARALSDGFIPKAVLLRIAGDLRKPDRLAGELVAAGLWELVAAGWQIHDWLQWNRPAAQIKAERAGARDRMQRLRSGGRQRSAASAAEGAANDAKLFGRTTDRSSATPVPVPEPGPVPGSEPSGLSEGESEGKPDDSENPQAEGQIESLSDRVFEKFGEVLAGTDLHNYQALCVSNRGFLDVWPPSFQQWRDEHGPANVTEALMRARLREVDDVQRPRAWLEAVIRETAEALKGPENAPELRQEPDQKPEQKPTKKRRKGAA